MVRQDWRTWFLPYDWRVNRLLVWLPRWAVQSTMCRIGPSAYVRYYLGRAA